MKAAVISAPGQVEITITGSMAVLHSFERAADLFARGVLDADLMISDRFALDDYPRALEQFKSGIGYKIQVTPFGQERNV